MLIARIAIALFLVFVPGAIVWAGNISGHDFARIAEIALCAFCVATQAVALCTEKVGRPRGAMILTLAGVAVLASASTLAAPNQNMALRELTVLLGLMGVAAVVACSGAWFQNVSLLAVISVGASFYTTLVLFGSVVIISGGQPLHPFDVLHGYINGRFYNHVQTAMLPLLAVAATLTALRPLIRRLAWFGLVTSTALLIFSQGRATMVALLCAITVSLLLFRRAAWPTVRCLVIATLMATVLYGLLFVALPQLLGSPIEVVRDGVADSGSAQSRFILWKIALDHISASPWLGIGPMHYAHHWNNDAAHPHNVYLQVAAEWGVPMLLLLLSLAIWGVWRLGRTVRACQEGEQQTLGAGLFLATLAIAADAALSGNFVMPVPQVWLAVVFGWAFGWTRRHAPPASRPIDQHLPRSAAVLLAAVLLVSQLWLCRTVWPEIHDIEARLEALPKHPQQGSLRNARFWSRGWF